MCMSRRVFGGGNEPPKVFLLYFKFYLPPLLDCQKNADSPMIYKKKTVAPFQNRATNMKMKVIALAKQKGGVANNSGGESCMGLD